MTDRKDAKKNITSPSHYIHTKTAFGSNDTGQWRATRSPQSSWQAGAGLATCSHVRKYYKHKQIDVQKVEWVQMCHAQK